MRFHPTEDMPSPRDTHSRKHRPRQPRTGAGRTPFAGAEDERAKRPLDAHAACVVGEVYVGRDAARACSRLLPSSARALQEGRY